MDTWQLPRENGLMARPGASRKQLARTLSAAYAGGLLSQETFERRVDQLLKARLIDPFRIIGDLNVQRSPRMPKTKLMRAAASRTKVPNATAHTGIRPMLLALDWNGGKQDLLLGRHHRCDLVFSNLNVSRRHARLVFRDGSWILHDLESTNGTFVNGVRVRRCELHAGDQLVLGNEALRVD
jgi:FHA domain